MALFRAATTGIASEIERWQTWNGTEWIKSVSFPTTSDTVYSNGFDVTIESDFEALSFSNAPLSNGVNSGGRFILNPDVTINSEIVHADLLTDAQLRASPIATSNSDVSTSNSTTTLLNAGATFTGEWEDVSAYPSLTVAVKTDQNGTYTVQFSPDGTNADSNLTRYFRTNQIEAPHRFSVTRRYARIVFTNTSASNQTYLRLQTLLGEQGELNAPIDSTLAQDFDATAVRPTDFHNEVALGRRQGVTTWNKFGYNLDVDTGTEIIASWGGTFQFSTTGETISIVSTSIADASGGTGVNSIVVYGVDANWDEQTVVYTMNGTTPVVSAESWIGINRVAVFLSGSGMTNAGTITVTGVTSEYTKAQMPLGGGVTQQMIFYVPDNHQFLARWLHFNALKVSGGGVPEITVLGHVYSAVNNTIQEVYRGQLDVANINDIDVNPSIPFPISERSILYFNATTDTDNTSVSGRFSGELFRDINA